MPNYVVDIAVDAVIGALGAFLQPFVGSAPIVRGQTNRTSMPKSGFVELTEILQVDLETPTTIDAAASASITGPKRIDIQVDFYGPAAGDQCTAVKTVYRSAYAVAQFTTPGIAPLYCSDGHQAPLVNAEQQYEGRWTLTASLQYNPTVVIPSQSAISLAVNILEDIP
jgi:hypothetical protein